MDGVALQPLVHIEKVDLLGPKQTGEGLALHQSLIIAGRQRVERRVELISLSQTLPEHLVDVTQRRIKHLRGETHAERDGTTCWNGITVLHARFCAELRWVDGVLTVDDVSVKRVLGVWVRAPAREARFCRSPGVRLIVGEEQLAALLDVEIPRPQSVLEQQVARWSSCQVRREHADETRAGPSWMDSRFRTRRLAPGPRIPKPELREEVDGCRVGTAVLGRDADDEVLG